MCPRVPLLVLQIGQREEVVRSQRVVPRIWNHNDLLMQRLQPGHYRRDVLHALVHGAWVHDSAPVRLARHCREQIDACKAEDLILHLGKKEILNLSVEGARAERTALHSYIKDETNSSS